MKINLIHLGLQVTAFLLLLFFSFRQDAGFVQQDI